MLTMLLIACTQISGPVEAPAEAPAPPTPAPVAVPAPVPDAPADNTPAEPEGRPAGAACLASTDCTSGVCEGEGCDEASPGVCASGDRMCTADVRPYCGCDEQTFQSSGSCPGARYAYEGECEPQPEAAPGVTDAAQ